MTNRTYPLVTLVILDGWGLSDEVENNAVAQAKTPVFDRLWATYPSTSLVTHGRAVGLPPGQMGNSEVGHLNIGAGRTVWQDIARIDNAIVDGSFHRNEVLRRALQGPSRVHLMGLASDGGVHAMDRHYFALIELASRLGRRGDDVVVHAFTDGRDTPPTSGQGYVRRLMAACRHFDVGVLGTVIGRYYALDRDRRYDRVSTAFRGLAYGEGEVTDNPLKMLSARYAQGQTDEFIAPIIVRDTPRVEPGDSVVFWNFRPDRARQIVMSLGWKPEIFDRFDRGSYTPARVTTLTHYRDDFDFPIVFPPQRLTGTLGQLISSSGLRQLRIAEAEKRAHVTYFLNGGRERAFDKEERVHVPSARVRTYDLLPEMSAPEVTRRVCELIRSEAFSFVVLNYANPDMVGHTGNYQAAVKAVEVVDQGLGQVVEAVQSVGGLVLVTADHGNCEQMVDPLTGAPHTAHTTNPVPFIMVGEDLEYELREGRALSAIAPTICRLLGLRPTPEMTAASLLRWD